MRFKISLYALALLALSLIVSIAACNHFAKKQQDTQAVLDTTVQAFKVLKNKEGKQVAEQKPAEFATGKAIKEASAKVFNLPDREEKKIKAVPAFVQVEQAAVITNDSVTLEPVRDSAYKFALNRQHYSLSGRISREMLYIDSLAIYNTISLRIAEKKKGWFKRELVVQAVNSNPYIATQSMRSMTVAQKTNTWNRYIKPALFAGIGYSIGKFQK